MRVIYILLALVIVFSWLGFELRHKYRDVAQVFFGVAGLLTILLIGGFFGWY